MPDPQHPLPAGGYAAAAGMLGEMVAAFFPAAGWVKPVAAMGRFAGLGADTAFYRRHARLASQYDPTVLYAQQADLYRAEADRLGAGRGSGVVTPARPTSAAPSRYLMEEGASRLDEDCFSCATAHMAAMEGALKRAEEQIRRTGTCDEECSRWLMLAAQEPSALFARDWTEQRYATTPEDQRRVIDRYTPRLQDIQRALLGSDREAPQREAVLSAAAMLKESTRFTSAGDDISHPEVEWRRLRAEADLTAAERVRVGSWPAQTATQLRRLRQQVGSGITSPDAMQRAAQQADDLAREVASPALTRLSAEDVQRLRAQVAAMRTDFSADRRRLGAAQGDVRVKANAVMADAGRMTQADLGHLPIRRNPHFPDRDWVDDVTEPIEGGALPPADVATMFDRIEDATAARGTQTWYRNLPSTWDATLFGMYDTERDVTLLDSAADTPHGRRDPFWFQVGAHEYAHSLDDGPQCRARGYAPGVDYEDQPSEVRAQAASLAAMLELGLPVRTADGSLLPAGQRRVNWGRLREKLGEQGVEDVRWTAGWLAQAARTGPTPELLAERCPERRRSA